MVDIRNIKWNGKYAVADLSEDGSKEIAYTIEVDCEAEKVVKNSNGEEMNQYISQAIWALCKRHRAGERPKNMRIMWY